MPYNVFTEYLLLAMEYCRMPDKNIFDRRKRWSCRRLLHKTITKISNMDVTADLLLDFIEVYKSTLHKVNIQSVSIKEYEHDPLKKGIVIDGGPNKDTCVSIFVDCNGLSKTLSASLRANKFITQNYQFYSGRISSDSFPSDKDKESIEIVRMMIQAIFEEYMLELIS